MSSFQFELFAKENPETTQWLCDRLCDLDHPYTKEGQANAAALNAEFWVDDPECLDGG